MAKNNMAISARNGRFGRESIDYLLAVAPAFAQDIESTGDFDNSAKVMCQRKAPRSNKVRARRKGRNFEPVAFVAINPLDSTQILPHVFQTYPPGNRRRAREKCAKIGRKSFRMALRGGCLRRPPMQALPN